METKGLNDSPIEANLNSTNVENAKSEPVATSNENLEVIEAVHIDYSEVADQMDAHEKEHAVEAEHHLPDSERLDYPSLSREELVAHLKHILKLYSLEAIKDEVDAIKINFYSKLNAEVALIKKSYIESGEPEESFAAPIDVLEHEMRELLGGYKKRRDATRFQIEEEKERNLKLKLDIIEKIKELLNRQESLNDTFSEFKTLQNRWKETGQVPQAKMRDIWENYNLNVERFYDYIKINRELKELDLKRNLEAKLDLCEKAEKLHLETSIVKAFKVLQKYHEEWREIGPITNEKKEEVWQRFREATAIINKRHQDYFEGLKRQLKGNLDAKIALCEKAEEIIKEEIESTKDWDAKSEQLIELQKVWKTIGFAPKKENNKVYDRFREACDAFFDKKREFYRHYKDEQTVNLQHKIEFCEKAEALKDSQEWKKATETLIDLQKKWKEIGPVPRKQSDYVWKRFRTACDHFFAQKAKHFGSMDEEQDANLKKKEELIALAKAFVLSENTDENFTKLQDFQKQWSEIGHVPIKEKDRVTGEFRAVINKHFDHLNLDEYNKNVQKFKNKISNLNEVEYSKDKINQERNKIIIKLKQLESDITLWENNIGFFAKSKNADALIKDFRNKIDTGKRNIKLLNEKLDMIDGIKK